MGYPAAAIGARESAYETETAAIGTHGAAACRHSQSTFLKPSVSAFSVTARFVGSDALGENRSVQHGEKSSFKYGINCKVGRSSALVGPKFHDRQPAQ
jgi:hypothetical protein